MKQQINFYGADFKPVADPLSLDRMLLVWLVGIMLMVVFYNYELERSNVAKDAWQMAQKREAHQLGQLDSLQASFTNRGDAYVLERTLEDMSSSLAQRNFVLDQLSQRVDGMSNGIAGLMESLAMITVDGLWLTTINVNQGQLSVTGITNDAEKVPQLILRLQNITALKDKRFARLEMKPVEDNDDLLMFSLQSENQIIGAMTKKSRRGTQ